MEKKSEKIDNIEDLEESVMTDSVESSIMKTLQKSIILGVVLVGLVVLAWHSPFKKIIDEAPAICEHIRNTGSWAPLVFTGGVVVLITFGAPRLALCIIGGMLFGFWKGLLWSQLGTMLAYYVVFLFVRWGGRDIVRKYVPKVEKFSRIVEKGGISSVILARQVPLYGMLINIMLGLSPVRHSHFIIGSLIGILPEAIPCVLAGSGITQQSTWMKGEYIGGALIAMVLAWLLLSWHIKRKKRTKRLNK